MPRRRAAVFVLSGLLSLGAASAFAAAGKQSKSDDPCASEAKGKDGKGKEKCRKAQAALKGRSITRKTQRPGRSATGLLAVPEVIGSVACKHGEVNCSGAKKAAKPAKPAVKKDMRLQDLLSQAEAQILKVKGKTADAPAAKKADKKQAEAKAPTVPAPDIKANVDSIVKKAEKPCKAWGTDPQTTRLFSGGSAEYADWSSGCQNKAVLTVLSSMEKALYAPCLKPGVKQFDACMRQVEDDISKAKEDFNNCTEAADACLKASVTELQASATMTQAAKAQCTGSKTPASCAKDFQNNQLNAAFQDVLNNEIPDAEKRFTTRQKDPSQPDFTRASCLNDIFDCEGPPLHYAKVDGKLFVKGEKDFDAIRSSDVSQGITGDCYFLSSLAAVANKDPNVIRQMIKDNGNGTYTVTLYTDKDQDGKLEASTFSVNNRFPVHDGDPNQAAFAQVSTESVHNPQWDKKFAELTASGYSKQKAEAWLAKNGIPKETEQKELWPMVAEKAFAESSVNGSYNAIGNGGYGSAALSDITGKIGEHFDSDVSFDKLSQLDGQGYAMVASSNINQDKDSDIASNHAYAVMGVDEEKGTITLFNPWGFANQDPDHPTYVTLSEDDFKKDFEGVDADLVR